VLAETKEKNNTIQTDAACISHPLFVSIKEGGSYLIRE